jgi:hypothetical protein
VVKHKDQLGLITTVNGVQYELKKLVDIKKITSKKTNENTYAGTRQESFDRAIYLTYVEQGKDKDFKITRKDVYAELGDMLNRVETKEFDKSNQHRIADFKYVYLSRGGKTLAEVWHDSLDKDIVSCWINRSLVKQTNESVTNTEDVVSKWAHEKDYDSKKKMFVVDTKEYLTGYFGTVELEKEKKIMTILSNIFDDAMKKKHHHGIDYVKNDSDYKAGIYTIAKCLKTNDTDTVYDMIDNIFND